MNIIAISDIHYSLKNLEIADKALRGAFEAAKERQARLVICGDLHDTKALLRGEEVAALIKTFEEYKSTVRTYLIVGNHDLLNEKGKEHALEFLRPYVEMIVDKPMPLGVNTYCIPYQNKKEDFERIVKSLEETKVTHIFCHQGVKGARMGEYAIDNSSVDVSVLKAFTVISGHYHERQTIGTLTYIGSPYSTSYSDANSGPKGYLHVSEKGIIGYDLGLKKHYTAKIDFKDLATYKHPEAKAQDNVRLEVSCLRSQVKDLKLKTDYTLSIVPNILDDINTELVKVSQTDTIDKVVLDSIKFLAYSEDQANRLERLYENL